MPSHRFKLVVAAMSVLTVATYLVEPYVGARSFQEMRGAPDFTLVTLNGTTFHLRERSNGTAVLVDFMATWCPPCREVVRQLAIVRGQYLPSKVQVLTVDVDFTETPQQLKDWLHTYSAYDEADEALGWSFAMDTTGQFVGPRYGANALPTLVLVDGAGMVRHTWVGTVAASDLEVALDAALIAVG